MSSDVLVSFEKALFKLDEALKAETSELIRDAAIQRFEFSYELMWKSLKNILKESGVICHSPKSCFKEAFSQGWIKDEELWLQMLSDRNLTTHTYDEVLAIKVYKNLPVYMVAMLDVLKCIKSQN